MSSSSMMRRGSHLMNNNPNSKTLSEFKIIIKIKNQMRRNSSHQVMKKGKVCPQVKMTMIIGSLRGVTVRNRVLGMRVNMKRAKKNLKIRRTRMKTMMTMNMMMKIPKKTVRKSMTPSNLTPKTKSPSPSPTVSIAFPSNSNA